MKINAYIKQAYPFYYEDLKKVFILLCCMSIISFLFSYLFEPFSMNQAEHKISSLWILILHAFIPIPIALGYLFLLNKTVKNTSHWTLGKEFLHLAHVLFLIGLASFFLRDFIYTNPDNWSFRYFWEEIRNTFLVGSLILVVILPLNLERLLYRHFNFLNQIATKSSITKKSNSIHINTPIPGEQFEVNIGTFLFAKVESNYIEIIYSSVTGFEKLLKRMTLKEFEEQLSSFPYVFKVHRSYLVNLQTIESISGNAQGYMLRLKNFSEAAIPVSRSKIQEFNRVFTNYNKK
ncbi:LytR/AlgR family response regulator transcription factor [Winogradskyella sp. UBA3174]|uniref:LytR/AlgR family response regulator transcription factor n=1 Tax=Winogradskyella sp. UBA3174 TaxID=1947785 RepID=UPI0025FABDB4|nr:LytTR family DNA-binding domain-containing protein [Winogradskyella sp. UBA3174]|tara:strand:+ start:875 stop:1747 length:873 start_codon:yes stop_codon:yes gene_type:complete